MFNKESTDFGIEISEEDSDNITNKLSETFKPSDINGLQLWLDASDKSTLLYNPITTPIPSNESMLKRQAFTNGNQPNGGSISTSNNVINTVTRHMVAANSAVWSSVRLHYANFYNSFTMVNNRFTIGTNTAVLTIKASIQIGSVIYQGSSTLTLNPGQTGYIDIPNLSLTDGIEFYVLTNCTKPVGTSSYPVNSRIRNNPVFEIGSVQGTNGSDDISATGLPYGAAATATVTSGSISALTLTSGGGGYTQDASVYAYEVQSTGVLTQKLIGTATVSGGVVTSLTLTDGTPPSGVAAWVTPSIKILYGGSIINLAANGSANGFGPSIITAVPDRPARSVLGLGDSILRASQGTTLGDINGNAGNFEFAVGNRIGFINGGINGIRALDFDNNSTNLTDYWYNFYTPYVTDVMINIGVNDVAWYYAVGYNSTQLFSYYAGMASYLRGLGLKVSWSTISPRTTSTDQFTTLAGQTTEKWGSGAVDAGVEIAIINAAIRNGTIPSDNNYIDFAKLLADPNEPTKWRVSDGLKTSDGLHPSDSITGSRNQNGVGISAVDALFKSYFNYALAPGGGYLAKWKDKSGYGRDLQQSDRTAQPLIGTRSLNNLNVIYFDGNSDAMISKLFPVLQQPLTHFIVLKFDKIGSDVYVMGGDMDVNDSNIFRVTNGRYLIGAPNTQQTFTASVSAVDIHVIKFNGDNSKHYIGSGSQMTVSGVGSGGFRSCSIGSKNATIPVTAPMQGIYAEILSFNNDLSTYDINRIGSYLANKWGTVWTPIQS